MRSTAGSAVASSNTGEELLVCPFANQEALAFVRKKHRDNGQNDTDNDRGCAIKVRVRKVMAGKYAPKSDEQAQQRRRVFI